MLLRGELDASKIAILEEDARTFLCAETGMALPLREATRLARAFADVAEGRLGVFVRQGVAEAGFFHRSLQEFLAADHLARHPLDDQQAFVQSHATDPRWREVILGLIWLTIR